jgi:hypothetical protein
VWGDLFSVEPGARTGIHHHGEQHTIAYVLSGSSYFTGATEASLTGTSPTSANRTSPAATISEELAKISENCANKKADPYGEMVFPPVRRYLHIPCNGRGGIKDLSPQCWKITSDFIVPSATNTAQPHEVAEDLCNLIRLL